MEESAICALLRSAVDTERVAGLMLLHHRIAHSPAAAHDVSAYRACVDDAFLERLLVSKAPIRRLALHVLSVEEVAQRVLTRDDAAKFDALRWLVARRCSVAPADELQKLLRQRHLRAVHRRRALMLYAFSGAHPYSIFVLKLMGIEIRLLLDHLADAEPATKTAATAAATPAAAAAAESAATATAAATAADATTSSAAPPASHSEPVADVDDDTDADVLSLFIACFENSMEVDIALTREVVRMLLQERCALRAADSFLAAYFTQDNGAEWSDDVALYLDSVCVSDPRWLAAISMRSNGIGGVRRRAAVGGGGVDDDDEIDDDDAALRDAVVADLEYLHGTVERLRPAAVRENRDELCAYFLCGGRGEGGAALPHFAALRAGDATVAHNAPLQKAMQERAQWLRDVYEAFRVYDDLTAACGLQCAAVALAEERRVRGDAGAAATAVAGDVASARLEPWLRDAVREFMGRATREEIGDSMWSRLQTLLRSFSE